MLLSIVQVADSFDIILGVLEATDTDYPKIEFHNFDFNLHLQSIPAFQLDSLHNIQEVLTFWMGSSVIQEPKC